MPSPFLSRSGCHVKGRRWRPWFSRSKIAAQKNKRHTKVCLLFFVTAHMFCCLHSRPPQGRGSVRGEPLTGSPTRVQSPARRRPLLRSKSAAPETKPPLRGGFVSGASSGIYPARGYKLRLSGGKTAKEEDTKRCLPRLVPRRGFEPRTPCLIGRCATY